MDDSVGVIVDIGDMPVRLSTTNRSLVQLLNQRYAGFVNPAATPAFEFDVSIVSADSLDLDNDLRVSARTHQWVLERGDFRAEWDSRTRRAGFGKPESYAVDSVLRIIHSLLLSTRAGSSYMHGKRGPRGARCCSSVRRALVRLQWRVWLPTTQS